MIALHDCNGDVNRAINVLLEGSPDTVSPYMDCFPDGVNNRYCPESEKSICEEDKHWKHPIVLRMQSELNV